MRTVQDYPLARERIAYYASRAEDTMHSTHNDDPSAAADMLQCRELVELITDYLEGALPAATRSRFEAHLEECAVCCAYVTDMAVLVERIGDLRQRWPVLIDRERLLTIFHDWRKQ